MLASLPFEEREADSRMLPISEPGSSTIQRTEENSLARLHTSTFAQSKVKTPEDMHSYEEPVDQESATVSRRLAR